MWTTSVNANVRSHASGDLKTGGLSAGARYVPDDMAPSGFYRPVERGLALLATLTGVAQSSMRRLWMRRIRIVTSSAAAADPVIMCDAVSTRAKPSTDSMLTC